MELPKNFDHRQSETNWYQHWLNKGYFFSTPDDREPYTVVIPPPNVTGVLHMGHCLNNTIQDILVRRARMQGKNACWVPGTDHASIATEAKVVQMLREKGIPKASLSRDEFLKYAWEWKEKYGGIILEQLRKLGCSLDWKRTTFTMDPDYYQSVIRVFVDLYNKGYIYRGKRMINWDVKAKTALSDEEVIRKETQQKLYYLRYAIEGSNESIIIATVRPETIMGDTAICVHPKDERYQHLHGKFALVPLINRRIPIITDEYVDMQFGTGALKVTPAHDMNDYQLGQKHNLAVVDIFNDDGTLNEAAEILVGEDRFDARKKIIPMLEAAGHLVTTEDYTSEVGYSERTDVVVEPRLSLQWWVDMKKLAGPALDVVLHEEIKFYPGKFKNLYRHWMENIKDWCISRQLWWGHRIPAWYDAQGNFVVAATREEAVQLYAQQFGVSETEVHLQQDEDCLDTWFSSWLWPFEVFKGFSKPGNPDIAYYYPTNTLVTAPEIIFFWVARMIMAGMEYQKQIPFREVYFTGIVRDKLGRKMSKSLGNSPDLLQLIDQYGADACRFGIMIASPAGNDLLWDESSNEQGRNFTNKIWNALKLIKLWEANGVEPTPQQSLPESATFASRWFEARLQAASIEMEHLFREFRLSEALKTLYTLIWDDYCSWYLEWIKPAYGQKIDAYNFEQAVSFFEQLMQLLHPYMPFITEEVYHRLRQRPEGDDLCIRQLRQPQAPDAVLLQQGALLQQVITSLRDVRTKNQLKPKDPIELYVMTQEPDVYRATQDILSRQLNAQSFRFTDAPVANSISAVVEKDKFFLVAEQAVDTQAQKAALLKDLDYYKGFVESVRKKLNNERFVQNAKPEVVNLERKKEADALEKIKAIEEALQLL
ncbi:MAG: valine--tRNA ligase [Lacibacter sp.]